MLNSYWLTVPFILQMLCMAADEFYFHRKRVLPKWERVGHPLDTLTVLLCAGWVFWLEPRAGTVYGFVLLAVFSCLFVTKDENVHRRYCSAPEQWLHAVLFMLHPLVLAGTVLLWPAVHPLPTPHQWIIRYSGFERLFLAAVLFLMAGFGFYQYGYWNLKWSARKARR